MNGNADRIGSVAVEIAAEGVSDNTVQQVFAQERKLETERLKTQRTQSMVEVITQNFDRILSFFEQLLDTMVGR